MKLKKGFILHQVGDEYMAVATGEAAKHFNGLVRNNKTAQFIFEQLLQDTTEADVVEAVANKFDAPVEQIAADVRLVLSKIREAGFLDE